MMQSAWIQYKTHVIYLQCKQWPCPLKSIWLCIQSRIESWYVRTVVELFCLCVHTKHTQFSKVKLKFCFDQFNRISTNFKGQKKKRRGGDSLLLFTSLVFLTKVHWSFRFIVETTRQCPALSVSSFQLSKNEKEKGDDISGWPGAILSLQKSMTLLFSKMSAL